MIEYFDSHCHLTDAAFRDDREAVLHRAAEAGVSRLVTIASSVTDARAALVLAEGHARVWCTAGVHPHEAGAASPAAIDDVRELAGRPRVVAIGETGLPVVVHAREADAEIAAALGRMPAGTRGVLHCFTGGEKAFAAAMEAGWYVSFSGIVSFKTFAAAAELERVPADRLLVETDAPYLAPVPMRGRRNEPALVVHVVEALARRLEVDPIDLARRTTENACRFYGVA